MSDKFELDICQGKYRYTYESGKQTVLRHGEPWPSMDQELLGNKFVYGLAVELHEKTQRLDSVMKTLAALAGKLGIDFETAKKAPGKPSDVFFEHFEKLRAENEQHQIDNASLNFQLAEAQLENRALRGYLEKIQEIASRYRDGVKFNYIADVCQEALNLKRAGVELGSTAGMWPGVGAATQELVARSSERQATTSTATRAPSFLTLAAMGQEADLPAPAHKKPRG